MYIEVIQKVKLKTVKELVTIHVIYSEERNPKSKESSKGNKKTIKELEASVEKLKQDLNSEKATNKALQAEIEKLRQQLDVERKSNKDLKLNVIRPTKTKIAKTGNQF